MVFQLKMFNEFTHEVIDPDHYVVHREHGAVSSVTQQLAIVSTQSKGDVLLYNSSNVTLRDIGHGTKMQLPCLLSDLSHLLRRGDIIENPISLYAHRPHEYVYDTFI